MNAAMSTTQTVTIRSRWNGKTLYSCELPPNIAVQSATRQAGYAVSHALAAGVNLSGADLRDADLSDADLRVADLRGADLRDADLRDADLSDAVLSDADLRGADLRVADLRVADLSDAYLRGADLRGAYLSDAVLSDADLSDADLRDAYLRDADLRDAYLRDADLRGADLRGADLRDADLRGAYLSGADLSGADLSDAAPETAEQRREREVATIARVRERFPHVPVVPRLDALILERIEADPSALEMGSWHTCDTTHCRAGWAVHLAGEAGYALEQRYDAEYAGRMIYRASVGYAPDFFADNETALADIRARAAEQVAA